MGNLKSSRVLFLMAITVIVVLLVLRLTLTPVLAHAELKLSDPDRGALLDRPPVAVFTWFSEPIEPGSQLKVFGSDFQPVTVGSTVMDSDDVSLMRIELTTLPPGRYTVEWQARSRDGSLGDGSFDFSVRDKPIEWQPLAAIGAAILGSVALLTVSMMGMRRGLRRLRRKGQG